MSTARKAVADDMFHPGSAPSAQLAERYRIRVEHGLSAREPEFCLRLDVMRLLVGLMWCAMLLDERRPDRWVQRIFAGMREAHVVTMARQLEKSRRLFGRLVACPQ